MAVALGRLDGNTRERVERQLMSGRSDTAGIAFQTVLASFLLFALIMIITLLWQLFSDGWGVFDARLGSFLSSATRTQPEETGVFQGLRGTFWIGVFVIAVAFPIGVGAAIYLQEYAKDTKLTRFIDLNIRNLAGVPSVVYGILGFTIFVKLFDGFFGDSGSHNGKTTAAAGVTLAVLVLPIVIITSSEAIRAVPNALREAGYGVGATKWEVIRTNVLPYAAPGIFTGTLLSLARALGEAAPLILVGAVQGKLGPNTGFFGLSQLGEQFTAMPIVITSAAKKPGDDWAAVTAAAILILLAVVLLANTVAILLRNRFEKQRAG